jgi:hypothetical protein
MAAPPVAPGWYPDPDGGGTRYWHGSGWSEPRRSRSSPDNGWAAINSDRSHGPANVGKGPPRASSDPAVVASPASIVMVECTRCGAGQHAPRDHAVIICSNCASELRPCACENCKWAASLAIPTLVKHRCARTAE